MNTNNNNQIAQIISFGLDQIADGYKGYGCDLHNRMFNEDYFIIGYAQADAFLEEYGIFDAIRKVQQYEKCQFGEVSTDLGDSEKVAGMIAYIIGQEELSKIELLNGDCWDRLMEDREVEAVKEALEERLKELE